MCEQRLWLHFSCFLLSPFVFPWALCGCFKCFPSVLSCVSQSTDFHSIPIPLSFFLLRVCCIFSCLSLFSQVFLVKLHSLFIISLLSPQCYNTVKQLQAEDFHSLKLLAFIWRNKISRSCTELFILHSAYWRSRNDLVMLGQCRDKSDGCRSICDKERDGTCGRSDGCLNPPLSMGADPRGSKNRLKQLPTVSLRNSWFPRIQADTIIQIWRLC